MAQAQASPVTFFSSCAGIHRLLPVAPDGNYLLYNNGNLITVYCADMSTTPSEYIDLAQTGSNANFSQYTAGGASPGTNVRTTFTKLRVDPSTLTVDIGDLKFASSTGSLQQGSTTVTSMPYSVAMSCVAPQNASGVGNINLLNTPFQVSSTFAVGGFQATGSATVSQNKQMVALAGGGYCGWIAPAGGLYNPFNPSPGMYDLKLSCGSGQVAAAPGQLCLHIGSLAGLAERPAQGNAMTLLYRGHPVALVSHHDQVWSLTRTH